MILMRTGYREARRTQFSVRCTSGNPSESFPTTSGSGVTPKLALSTMPRYFAVEPEIRNTSTGVPERVCEIWVSLKFASTHQFRLSIRVNNCWPTFAYCPSIW